METHAKVEEHLQNGNRESYQHCAISVVVSVKSCTEVFAHGVGSWGWLMGLAHGVGSWGWVMGLAHGVG